MILLLLIIAANFSSILCVNVAVCGKASYDRSAGSTAVKYNCSDTEDLFNGLCYQKCDPLYEPVGCCTCRYVGCPTNTTETADKLACTKPSNTSYARTAYPWLLFDPWDNTRMFNRCETVHGKGNCEECALIVYPKCKTDYRPEGCGACVVKCPANYTDTTFSCVKSVYTRKGIDKSYCDQGLDKSLGKCYTPCSSITAGTGPMCTTNCSANSVYKFDCGFYCTKNFTECASLVIGTAADIITVGISAISGGIQIGIGIPLGPVGIPGIIGGVQTIATSLITIFGNIFGQFILAPKCTSSS